MAAASRYPSLPRRAFFLRHTPSVPHIGLALPSMAYPRPPFSYREATNRDPCGGLQNVNNGCQVIFPRMKPGDLCFLCLKLLQDPALNKDNIRVRSSRILIADAGVLIDKSFRLSTHSAVSVECVGPW